MNLQLSSLSQKKIFLFILSVCVFTLINLDANAQCAMCKASIESSDKMKAYTEGINKGIYGGSSLHNDRFYCLYLV